MNVIRLKEAYVAPISSFYYDHSSFGSVAKVDGYVWWRNYAIKLRRIIIHGHVYLCRYLYRKYRQRGPCPGLSDQDLPSLNSCHNDRRRHPYQHPAGPCWAPVDSCLLYSAHHRHLHPDHIHPLWKSRLCISSSESIIIYTSTASKIKRPYHRHRCQCLFVWD